jgi:hypothetical protein
MKDSQQIYDKLNSLRKSTLDTYKEYCEKVKHPILMEEDDPCIIDYMDQSSGLYTEAVIKELRATEIVVKDNCCQRDVLIDYTDLAIEDRIQVLQIYEEQIN